MMLVQKPQPISLSAHHHHHRPSHRRQTSAPPVVVVAVKPTPVPGLLSLSKPASAVTSTSPVRRLNTRAHPKSSTKQAATTSTPAGIDTAMVRAQAATTTPTAEMDVDPATPSPQSRGRRKTTRSQSRQSCSPLKHGLRQPSSPQAEAPVPVQSSIDPFSDSKTKAIPVRSTRFNDNANNIIISQPALARSEPVPSPMATYLQRKQRRPRPLPPSKKVLLDFPICDDMSEIAADDADPMDVDTSNSSSSTPIPVTPTRPQCPPHLFQSQQQQKRRPEPMSSRSKKASSLPPPSPQRPSYQHSRTQPDIRRKHNRTPSESEGVFHMSSDEEHSHSSVGPAGISLNLSVTALFPLGGSASRSGSTSATPLGTPPKPVPAFTGDVFYVPNPNGMSTSLDKATFFASSMFQNSPSPEELPDPLLL